VSKTVVVVGGGTAGWLTALMAKKSQPNLNITVIESKEIGILGAGEGSTPHLNT
jgi:glycine/D-amino acid oxidase-like deaminating enzyme